MRVRAPSHVYSIFLTHLHTLAHAPSSKDEVQDKLDRNASKVLY